jgi:hypothetical protein
MTEVKVMGWAETQLSQGTYYTSYHIQINFTNKYGHTNRYVEMASEQHDNYDDFKAVQALYHALYHLCSQLSLYKGRFNEAVDEDGFVKQFIYTLQISD